LAKAKPLRVLGSGATRVRSPQFAEISTFATLGPRWSAYDCNQSVINLWHRRSDVYPVKHAWKPTMG